MDTRSDLEAGRDGETRAVDDGLLADVLDGGGMGEVEARAAGGGVEVGPDDLLVVVGQEPWIGGC